MNKYSLSFWKKKLDELPLIKLNWQQNAGKMSKAEFQGEIKNKGHFNVFGLGQNI